MIDPQSLRVVGRYALCQEIAAGGMATVHLGRLLGPVGFARTVAIKRLHPQFAKDPEFVSMFLDEARLAARIQHPNVVSTLDVVALEGELFLVMEYVSGEALSRLIRASASQRQPIPLPVIAAIVAGALWGLHSAHEARTETGAPLNIVHRDISPQNILVGVDGVARVLDFGIAKAAGRLHQTREGQLKGKLSYMSPEQVRSAPVDRRADVYAASVVLWEMLTLRRAFDTDDAWQTAQKVLAGLRTPPSSVRPDVPATLDEVVLRGCHPDPAARFATAMDMANAIESACPLGSATQVTRWVGHMAEAALRTRAQKVAEVEGITATPNAPGWGPVSAGSGTDRQATLQTHGGQRNEGEGAAPPPHSALPTLPGRSDNSQVTAAAVSTSVGHTPARVPAKLVWIVAGCAAIAATLALGFLLGTTRGPGNEAAAHNAAAAAPAPSAPASSVSAVQLADAPDAAPQPAAAESTAAAAPPPARSSLPSRPPAGSARKAPTGPAKPNCDPPYFVDAQGVRRFKVECL